MNETAEHAVESKITLPVEGMTCASCALTVEKSLRKLEGVKDVSVSIATHSARIGYDNDFKIEGARKAVQAVGYDLVLPEKIHPPKPFDHSGHDMTSLGGAMERSASEEQGEPAESHDHMEHVTAGALELRNATIGSFILTVPVVLLGMTSFLPVRASHWIQLPLAGIVVFWFGRTFFKTGFKQARHLHANMDTLVGLSAGVAYVISAIATLDPSLFTSAAGSMMNAPIYFESAAVIVSFILLGRLLESKATQRTSSALSKLMGLQPKMVRVRRAAGEMDIPIEQVLRGEEIVLRPGERVPVDGCVIEGKSYVDESMLTGEPVAVEKNLKAEVYAGTINQKGSLVIRAEKVGSETMLAQIVRRVEDAQSSKAPVQKLVDRIAAVFVPVVIVISVLTFVAWIAIGGSAQLSHAILAAVTVLVIACPCALGLATPTAIIAGVGKAAEHGILIRDAASLESARKVDTMVMDKTGTITKGSPMVTKLIWSDEARAGELAPILYAMESRSEHPLAAAVVEHLHLKGALDIQDFNSLSGKGVSAAFGGVKYFAGSARLLAESNLTIPETIESAALELASGPNTVLYFFTDKEVLAIVAIADPIKQGAKEAIAALRNSGIEVEMLTGDSVSTAKYIANEVGITEWKAELLPADKAEEIKKLQKSGKIVAMVGDGINDSEALALADVGIAMGHGTDIAMEVATITIVSSDLRRIPEALDISRRTVRTIRQNLFWAFVYNLVGIPIAAGVLYPFTGFLLSPMIASAAMALSSVSVVSNSLRLRSSRIQ